MQVLEYKKVTRYKCNCLKQPETKNLFQIVPTVPNVQGAEMKKIKKKSLPAKPLQGNSAKRPGRPREDYHPPAASGVLGGGGPQSKNGDPIPPATDRRRDFAGQEEHPAWTSADTIKSCPRVSLFRDVGGGTSQGHDSHRGEFSAGFYVPDLYRERVEIFTGAICILANKF
jgi:hypothetical protein